MDLKNAENKLKKKLPNFFLEDIKPVDILVSNAKNGKCAMNAKDLYMLDIQSFIGQIFCKQLYMIWPRWCRMIKPDNYSHIHLFVFDEMSSYSWNECLIQYSESKKFKRHYEKLMENFPKNLKFINPNYYGFSWKTELFQIPNSFLSKKFNLLSTMKPGSGKQNLKRNFQRKLKSMLSSDFECLNLIREKYQLEFPKKTKAFKPKPDTFPRTQLLMSLEQMKIERVPISGVNNPRWANFKCSIPTGYAPVTPESPLFALDCEMVECHDQETDKFVKGLASISVVNEKRETVYKTFVKPSKVIVNYLTKYSGITYEIVQAATHTLEDVQRDLAAILPADAILVGHSISNDLEALELFHPYVIDTSVIYNLRQIRIVKPKLKTLSIVFLNRDIQNASLLGHDSHEDAIATMDLVLLKLSKSLDFGDIANSTEDKKEAENDEEMVEKNEITETICLTESQIHLRHKQALQKCYEKNETVNLLKFVDKHLTEKVATVNDDMAWFKAPWFPDSLKESTEPVDESNFTPIIKNFKAHPLKISEISFQGLSNEELPNKKWFTKLLRKINKEFTSLPANSLCMMLMVDGPYHPNQQYSEFGKAYFGITPWNTCENIVSMTVD